MNNKLTLSIDQQLIVKAKREAKERGTSLSAMVTAYLKTITHPNIKGSLDETPISSTVAGLRGSIKLNENVESYTKTIHEYREDKWGKE